MKPKFIALFLIALATAATAKPMAPIEIVIRSTFAPYSDPRVQVPDYFARPPWSAQTRALIKRWQNKPKSDQNGDDVTPLSNGDWLCQCQEWDNKLFRVNRVTVTKGKAGRMIAAVRYRVTAVDLRVLTFVLIREGGAWRIDDLIFPDQRQTLKAQLRREIADAAK